jgi:uncharacterized protein (DUF1330 family)
MAAYAIGLLNIASTEWVKSYIKPTGETIAQYGGRYLARGGATELLEGALKLPSSVVVLEFPIMDQARAWYHGPEYAPLKTLRQSGSTLDFILVDGLPAKN